MHAALALLALLAAGSPPVDPAATPEGAAPAPALALVTFSVAGDEAEANRAFLEQHVVSWVRRWGQPLDDAQEVQARVGAAGAAQLAGCSAHEPDCHMPVYKAALSGSVSYNAGVWNVVLVVTGADGKRWTSHSVKAASLTELLTQLVTVAQEIADTVAAYSGRPIHYDRPTRPYATVPFIVTGATLATGVVFFILSGVENSKLSNASLPLSDAVSARNAAHTYAIVGYSLTAVAVASAAVGLILYAPGSRPPAPAVTLSVEPSRGILVLGGPLP
jgi:hypothetical protein